MELKGRNLSSRMKGEDVTLLQEELVKLGFIIADEDGYFGKSTLDAVTVFQEKSGLQATGIVDQETVTMINLALESRNQDKTPKVSA